MLKRTLLTLGIPIAIASSYNAIKRLLGPLSARLERMKISMLSVEPFNFLSRIEMDELPTHTLQQFAKDHDDLNSLRDLGYVLA